MVKIGIPKIGLPSFRQHFIQLGGGSQALRLPEMDYLTDSDGEVIKDMDSQRIYVMRG